MNLITIGIGLYILTSIVVGLLAARRVKTAKDFWVANKSLPLYLSTATVFATWFGAETILGSAAEVSHRGLIAIIIEPLGAALCLLLVGIFIVKPLYKLNLLTIGDFFRERLGSRVEIISSVLMASSYLGWIAGQMVAIGVLGNLLLGIDFKQAIIIGSAVAIIYTFWGGMWSVAVLDFFQNILIIIGLVGIGVFVFFFQEWHFSWDKFPPNFFVLYPQEGGITSWLNYGAAWITVSLGSIPQQDVFQRVMAAKSQKVAYLSSFLGGALYLSVGFLPIMLAVYIRSAHPDMIATSSDAPEKLQNIIPQYIISNASPILGLLFLGALFSAILSTASGAILASASVLSENIISKIIPILHQKFYLAISRICVLFVYTCSLFLALSSQNIRELVEDSSGVSLVSLFIPFMLAIYTKKKWNVVAQILAILSGTGGWLVAKFMNTEVNPLIYGLVSCVVPIIIIE
ncbi:MAG: sodium:solute symporter family protein, partial [Bacteroidia bacterium]|nr:sodium:solute symporter family protein [Bacteroidia bacterium]